MRHRRLATTALGAVAALALTTASPAVAAPARPDPAQADAAAGSGRSPAAHVWVTTPDRSELMHDRGSVPFSHGASDELTISVDPSRTYQGVDGFGGSLTDSSAAVLYRLDPQARDAAMRQLFDPVDGVGLSALRQPIGSSDFTDEPHYTYDDVPAGETDLGLEHFSIDHDRAQVLPLLRRALELNPDLTVIGTPWSPPAWMKTSDSLVGGRLKDDPEVYDAYARYLVMFVQAYADAGVPVDYLTVQNEPQNRNPSGYPGTDMPVAQEAAVVEALGPALQAAGLGTKILGYDHNWSTHPDDVAATPPGADPETDYPYELLETPAAQWLAGTAYHCYSGDPSAMTALHDAHPDKGVWFTECSGSHGADDTPAQYFRGTLTWHARTITIGTMRNWARSAITWNVALDPQGGPHDGGCDTCTGMLTVADDGTVTTDAELYTIGHLSKFVQPGAERIASTSFGTTGWNGEVTDVAFTNPDGSTALVVHNENDDPRTFAVSVAGRSFDYTLPGGALATFTWPRLADRHELLALDDATVTASSGDDTAAVADDDATTRWSSGTGQEPGQYVQVDLGERTGVRRVVLDTGTSTGDYPRAWTLQSSTDGQTWRDVRSGEGSGQLTTIDVGLLRTQHLRVVQTGSAGSWWSVADLRVYG